jgi:hypothetical protein
VSYGYQTQQLQSQNRPERGNSMGNFFPLKVFKISQCKSTHKTLILTSAEQPNPNTSHSQTIDGARKELNWPNRHTSRSGASLAALRG